MGSRQPAANENNKKLAKSVVQFFQILNKYDDLFIDCIKDAVKAKFFGEAKYFVIIFTYLG